MPPKKNFTIYLYFLNLKFTCVKIYERYIRPFTDH